MIGYEILGYLLYIFLIGFLFGLSKKFFEKTKNNEEYTKYLDRLKKLIKRDNIASSQESQETVVQLIKQKISRTDRPDINIAPTDVTNKTILI